MQELIEKMKHMNEEYSKLMSQMEFLGNLAAYLMSIRTAMNELATEIILLEEEVHRNGKGEL